MPELSGPLAPADDAWDLLTAVEQVRPDVVREVLTDPHVGLSLALVLRSWPGSPAEAEARGFWRLLGDLHCVSAAAAARAGVAVTVRVPVRDGAVVLPDLGVARPGGGHDIATVRVDGGVVSVQGSGRAVVLPDDPERDAPGWQGIRRVRSSAGDGIALALNDTDPHTLGAGLAAPSRLAPADADAWQAMFDDAWHLLVADHPDATRALSAGMRSIVPLPRGERFRPRSGSGGDSCGCAMLSLPDDATQFAVTLIHEFSHSTLSALMHLVQLHDGATVPEHYAPWRDDPRPIGGLLQGVFAFSGVTDFYRARRRLDADVSARLADFEYALWRRQTRAALETVENSGSLTALGRRFASRLRARTETWDLETDPGVDACAGERAAEDHYAAWRAHHVAPSAPATAAAVDSWATSEPATGALDTGDIVLADPEAAWLDVTAVLARWAIVDPEGFERIRHGDDPGASVAGASTADVAYVDGDLTRARELYLTEALGRPDRPGAWARLGRLAPAPETSSGAGSELLLTRPETVRAVHRQLATRGGPAPTPWDVAERLAAHA